MTETDALLLHPMPSPFRILVTGWRDWPEKDAWYIYRKLWWAASIGLYDKPEAWRQNHENLVVVQGECPYGGVDHWADLWAKRYGKSEAVPANWKDLGKRAGIIRNQIMVDRGANICVAFPGPGSRGTYDCMTRAREAGIAVHSFPWSENLTWD